MKVMHARITRKDAKKAFTVDDLIEAVHTLQKIVNIKG